MVAGHTKSNKKAIGSHIPQNPVNMPPVCKPTRIYAPQICNPINIPNIRSPYICPPNIGPSTLPSLRNIKFTKNVPLPQVFSCILVVQFIYLQ